MYDTENAFSWPEDSDTSVGSNPIEWPDLVTVEPRLIDVERLVVSSNPPQDAAGFWSLWDVLQVQIRGMLRDSPLSMGERQRVREHLVMALDDEADRLAGSWNQFSCLPHVRDDDGRAIIEEEPRS
jgi:hypothetical protein